MVFSILDVQHCSRYSFHSISGGLQQSIRVEPFAGWDHVAEVSHLVQVMGPGPCFPAVDIVLSDITVEEKGVVFVYETGGGIGLQQ